MASDSRRAAQAAVSHQPRRRRAVRVRRALVGVDRGEPDELRSCTIITYAANPRMAEIHDRMPVNPDAGGGGGLARAPDAPGGRRGASTRLGPIHDRRSGRSALASTTRRYDGPNACSTRRRGAGEPVQRHDRPRRGESIPAMAVSLLVASYDHVILDLDGTVWVGGVATPRAPEAIAGHAVRALTLRVRDNDGWPHHRGVTSRSCGRSAAPRAVEEVVSVGSADPVPAA